MGIIEIEGMKFYAFHGHFEAERIVGNEFVVDIKLKMDFKKAVLTDDLNDALNYQAVYEIIKQEMSQNSKLLEHVANRILDALFFNFTQIKKAKLKISKLNPPMGGQIKKVGVRVTR